MVVVVVVVVVVAVVVVVVVVVVVGVSTSRGRSRSRTGAAAATAVAVFAGDYDDRWRQGKASTLKMLQASLNRLACHRAFKEAHVEEFTMNLALLETSPRVVFAGLLVVS